MNPTHRPLIVTGAFAAVVLSSVTWAQLPTLVDITPAGVPPVLGANDGQISADGRWVAFVSTAPDLVPGDTNADSDVFLRDRVSSAIVRVSVATGGAESHPAPIQTTYPTIFVGSPAVSQGGRFVAFASSAPDLVPADTNQAVDVFVRDLFLGTTERVSVGPGGAQGNSESGLAYVQSSGFAGPFTYAVASGLTISRDGRYVVFASTATNLVAAATPQQSVFLHDRTTGITELVSANPSGVGAGPSWYPSISADARYVAFESMAADLVAGDTNLKTDVFLRDRTAGTTVRVSLGTGGVEGNGPSGFNLFDPPFCADCGIQAVYLGSQLSADGRIVVFGSEATNFASVPGGTSFTPPRNVFRHDTVTGVTTLVSANAGGSGGNGSSIDPSVSSDGRFIAYQSDSDDIVAVPPQTGSRIFRKDHALGTTTVISVDSSGITPYDSATAPTMADDGARVAFMDWTALDPVDQNQAEDVYASGPAVPTFADACEGSVATCPCANVGAPGAGCANSAQPAGTRLEATGLPSVSLDSIVLVATRLVPNTVALFAQSLTVAPTASAPILGDGVRCMQGTVRRLATRNATGDTAQLGVPGDPRVSVLGQLPAGGGTRYYQVVYRNAVPFCTPSTFNTSNAIRIDWIP